MVKKILVNELIEDGAILLCELDRQDFPVEAMFWVDLPDQDYWRLVIASPLVRARGPAAAYRHLGEILRGMHLSGLALEDISLLEPESQQYRAFRSVAENSSGLAVGSSWVLFDDAVVYRWNSVSLTAELTCEIGPERLAQVWKAEQKLSPGSLPGLLFTVQGRRLTMRFHPQHGPKLGRIKEIKKSFPRALQRPDAFPDCEINWLD